MVLEIGECGLARASLPIRRNRVLQIEDQSIGPGLRAFRKLAFAVGRDEEVRARHGMIPKSGHRVFGQDHAQNYVFGRISMKA